MKNRYIVGLVFTVALLALAFVAFSAPAHVSGATAESGVQAVLTPVSVPANGFAGAKLNFMPRNSRIVTSTAAYGEAVQVGKYKTIDVQSVVDVGSANTITLTLQYSNDGVNFVDGPVVGAVAADANTMVQYAAFGDVMRLKYDAASTTAITITSFIAVGK